jgi:hypothetical protein
MLIVSTPWFLCADFTPPTCGFQTRQPAAAGALRPPLVWSLGLAVTASAQNARIAAIGNLIAPLGWGFLSGLLLHFTLLLFQKKKLALGCAGRFSFVFSRALMVQFFSVWPALGINNDTYLQTPFGWVPVVRPDVWDVLFLRLFGFFNRQPRFAAPG